MIERKLFDILVKYSVDMLGPLGKLIFNSEFFFLFCPSDLSYGEGGLLESSTMIVTALVCL